jgi:hypothetical protein
MTSGAQPRDNLRTFVNAGLIVSLAVMAVSFYVRFDDPYPPYWTAFAMPAAMALFGLRLILLPPSARHDASSKHGRSQRTIGSLLILLSLILLLLSLFELDRAHRSRAANFDPTSTNPDGDL